MLMPRAKDRVSVRLNPGPVVRAAPISGSNRNEGAVIGTEILKEPQSGEREAPTPTRTLSWDCAVAGPASRRQSADTVDERRENRI